MQLSRLLSAVIQKLNKPVCCCYWRYLVLYENIPTLDWHSLHPSSFRQRFAPFRFTTSSIKDSLAILRRGTAPALISFGGFSPHEKTLWVSAEEWLINKECFAWLTFFYIFSCYSYNQESTKWLEKREWHVRCSCIGCGPIFAVWEEV